MQAQIHPLWLRICHWINVISITCMISSGWRIYNASPLFNFNFPDEVTLGGWLGGALQWHFAMMWLFALNGLIYITLGVTSGHFKEKLLKISIKSAINDIYNAMLGSLHHQDIRTYNNAQKIAYIIAILLSIIMIASGLVLWKSVQFQALSYILGGYNNARYIHFFGMTGICSFIILHLTMVIIVPKTFVAMLRGH